MKCWDEDFARIHEDIVKPGYVNLVLPCAPLGTTNDRNGLRSSAPNLFRKLTHRLRRLLKGSANADDDSILHVTGKSHGHSTTESTPAFDKTVDGVPTPTALRLNAIQADPHLRRLIEHVLDENVVAGRQHLDRALSHPSLDYSRTWLTEHSRLRHLPTQQRTEWAAKAERCASDGVLDDEPPDDAPDEPGVTAGSLRHQKVTMNAPIHPLGLERYQAGPIVSVPINDIPAKALMDSGNTSTMKSCWCLIQRDYCAKSGIKIDPTTKYRITLADGTASETDGTAEVTLQFPHGKFSVTARVYHMPDPDTFDILLGHSFMLEHDVSVWNDSTSEGPQHGIRFPGGTVLPFVEQWDRSKTEIQAFCVDVNSEVTTNHLRMLSVSSQALDDTALTAEEHTVLRSMSATNPHPPPRDEASRGEGQDRTGCQIVNSATAVAKRMQAGHDADIVRRKNIAAFDEDCGIQDMTKRTARGETPPKARTSVLESGPSLTDNFLTNYEDTVWTPEPDAAAKGGIAGWDLEWLGSCKKTDSDYDVSPEFEDYARRLQSGQLPEGSCVIHFDDVPSLNRIEEGLPSIPVFTHVQAALEAEQDLPVRLRLVTHIMEKQPSAMSPLTKMTSLGFLRLVKTMLAPADKIELGQWAMTIAPPAVMNGLSAPCLEKVMVNMTNPDGSITREEMDVEALKVDIIDHETGRALGERRSIYDEDDPTRTVKSATPFRATLKPEYDPAINPNVVPWNLYHRCPTALKEIYTQWVLDSVARGIIVPHKSSYSAPIIMIRKPPKSVENAALPPEHADHEAATYRIICDMRLANQAMVETRWPQCTTAEVFESVKPSMKYFSSLDLRSAFFQLSCSPDCLDLLAFLTHPIKVPETHIKSADGEEIHVKEQIAHQFAWRKLPQGSGFSPAVFQKALSDTLRNHIPHLFGSAVVMFVDDLMIMSKTAQEHWEILCIHIRKHREN